MQTSSLVHHLIDLNAGESERTAADVLAPFGATHSATRMAAADAAGFERGRLSGAAEMKRVLAEQDARFTSERDLARRQWTEAEGQKLAGMLDKGMATVRDELALAIAQTMSPFIVGRLREQALEDLTVAAEELVSEHMPLAIEISGPPDLTAALAERLESLATVIRVAAVVTPELRVRVDKRVIETRLNDWIQLIEDALR